MVDLASSSRAVSSQSHGISLRLDNLDWITQRPRRICDTEPDSSQKWLSMKDFKPTLAQLRVFVEICNKRNFRAAAESLGLTQPSLSQSLSALEKGLGTALIERSTRTLMLTTAGEILLPQAKVILRETNDFMEFAQQVSGSLVGKLRIGLIPTVAPYILHHMVDEVTESFPDVRLRFVEEMTLQLAEMLKFGTIDAAVLALPSGLPAVTEIPLVDENFLVALPHGHPLEAQDSILIDDLAEESLLLLNDGNCLRDNVMDVCRTSLNPLNYSEHKVASIRSALRCVDRNIGVAIIPAMAGEDAAGYCLTLRPLQMGGPGRSLGLVVRSSDNRRREITLFAEGLAPRVSAPAKLR